MKNFKRVLSKAIFVFLFLSLSNHIFAQYRSVKNKENKKKSSALSSKKIDPKTAFFAFELISKGAEGASKLLENGAKPWRTIFSGDVSILHLIITEKNNRRREQLLKDLLRKAKEDLEEVEFKEFINLRDNNGSTALYQALDEKFYPYVDILLSFGAKFCNKLNSGITSLHLVAGRNRLNYYNKGILPELNLMSDKEKKEFLGSTESSNGNTALHFCFNNLYQQDSYYKMAELLVKQGADLLAINNHGESPMTFMLVNPIKMQKKNTQKDIIYFRIIISIYQNFYKKNHTIKNINKKDFLGHTPLFLAVKSYKDVELIKMIFDMGANPFLIAGQPESKVLPISVIIPEKNPEFVELTKDFIEVAVSKIKKQKNNKNKNKKRKKGRKNKKRFKKKLNPMDQKDFMGITPLTLAAISGNRLAFDSLLKGGASVSIPLKGGLIPLDVFRFYLEKSINFQKRNLSKGICSESFAEYISLKGFSFKFLRENKLNDLLYFLYNDYLYRADKNIYSFMIPKLVPQNISNKNLRKNILWLEKNSFLKSADVLREKLDLRIKKFSIKDNSYEVDNLESSMNKLKLQSKEKKNEKTNNEKIIIEKEKNIKEFGKVKSSNENYLVLFNRKLKKYFIIKKDSVNKKYKKDFPSSHTNRREREDELLGIKKDFSESTHVFSEELDKYVFKYGKKQTVSKDYLNEYSNLVEKNRKSIVKNLPNFSKINFNTLSTEEIIDIVTDVKFYLKVKVVNKKDLEKYLSGKFDKDFDTIEIYGFELPVSMNNKENKDRNIVKTHRFFGVSETDLKNDIDEWISNISKSYNF